MRGLVLEGGGVKGSYQIGAFYALKKCGIKFNGFVGTSIGSFNAAMLASNMEYELLNFWYNVSPGTLLGMDPRFVDLFNNKEMDINGLMGAFNTLKDIVKNLGIDNTTLLNSIKDVVNYDKLQKSNKDFGLVTVRVNKLKAMPLYIYKEDIINQENLIEYLMASCYLPVFKERKMIDDHYYIDGGFYDNSPVKLLRDKGYNEVYIIKIKGIGINRHINSDIKTIIISPSRENGSVLELNREIIKDNIMMGFYDTLRVVKKLDGYRYCFKRRPEWYYNWLTKKVNKKLEKRVKSFFRVSSNRDTIIKALEYIMEKENITYYDVYKPYNIINKIKKINNKNFIYRYIRELKFF